MSACLLPVDGVLGERRPGEPVGLVAGWGRFPIAFAEKARTVGLPVVCVGLRGHADPALAGLVSRFHWCNPLHLGRMIRLLRGGGVRHLVLAGKVHKADLMYRPWKLLRYWPDWRTLRAWYFGRRQDNKDDNVLLGIVAEFARDGLTVASALELCPELIVKPGVLTRRRPTAGEQADVLFGWELAKAMGGLDVGQSVAIEGTDRAIQRAGELCRAGGFTVVKVAKPRQDMRFDVPTVGCMTIETMHRAGATVLAVEAGKTILLDQEQAVALADRLGIAIVALTG
jgi:hypothetical protein